MIKGSRHSLEAIRKMSESHKGTVVSPGHRKKLSEAFKGKKNHFFGRKHTLESKRKMSQSLKGRKSPMRGKKHSIQTKQKMSKRKKGKKASLQTKIKMSEKKKGKNNSFYGKKHKPESRRRISENNSGENFSPERRKRLSELHKGTKATLETRIKLCEANGGENNGFYGKTHNPKTRKILSEQKMGEKNACWRGGISFQPYGVAFNRKLKEFIRARDNYRCQECFRHETELFTKKSKPRKLICHHINYLKTDNSTCNLISLCLKCHGKTNYKRKDWTKYFQKKLKALQLHRIFVKKTLPNQF